MKKLVLLVSLFAVSVALSYAAETSAQFQNDASLSPAAQLVALDDGR